MILQDTGDIPPTPLWAYGYELIPPVMRERMTGVQDILDAAHLEAYRAGRIWEGRFVNGDRITHILVVSGTGARDLPVNRRLEAELVRLEARFSVTSPLEVVHGPPPAPVEDQPSESAFHPPDPANAPPLLPPDLPPTD